MIHLLSNDGRFNNKNGCFCSYFRGPAKKCQLHDHEFFELFITTNDAVIHEIGGVRTMLEKNTLMFIRPHDIHRYADEGQGEFSFINLCFPKETLDEISAYLHAEKHVDKLVVSSDPPTVVLSDEQAQSLVNQFLNLMGDSMVSEPRIYSRGVIAAVLSMYFINHFKDTFDADIPNWLVSLCVEMHKIEVFSKKLPEICASTEKSYGYICHCFKKYLSITPTEYLNTIRLSYAGNMLLNSNMSVLDVSLECGFENLAHFYKLFKRKNGTSPSKYRKMMNTKLII